jgi:hypothetical protein
MKKLTCVWLALAASSVMASAQTLNNYQATVTNQVPNYYFTFDNGSLASRGTNATVITWSSAPATFTQFGFDVFGNPVDSAYFLTKNDLLVDAAAGTDGLINSGGGGSASTNSTASGSISFLFKSLDPGSYTAQKYIFSAGIVNSNHNSCSLLFQNANVALGADTNALVLRFGGNDTAILPFTNVVPDTWYYFALTYTEATNGYFYDSTGTNLVAIKGKWYLGVPGGVLASGLTTNAIDAVAGQGFLYLGNSPATSAGFAAPGSGFLDEFATWNRRLSDAEVQAQFTGLPVLTKPPLAQYQSAVTAQSPGYYFKMDGDFVDSVSGTLTLGKNGATVGVTYDYFGNSTDAVYFVSTSDALTNGVLTSGGGGYTGVSGTGKGSISCLFYTLASTNVSGQRFVFTAGGTTATTNALRLFFENWTAATGQGSLKLGFGDTSHVVLDATNIVPSTWYYFAMNYDESQPVNQVNWWLGQPGGTLQSGNFSATIGSLAGDGTVLVVGNNTNYNAAFRNSTPASNGRIDEFAIWHTLLSSNQVAAQFSALSVSTGPPPLLSIAVSGPNAIISWPSSTDAGYSLQSTTNLASATWNSAGTPATVGGQFVVTNALNPNAQFYRLKK